MHLERWLLATLGGGGALLLLVWLGAACLRQPVRRTRWVTSGLLAAVALSLAGLAPAWLIVPLPESPSPVGSGEPAPDDWEVVWDEGAVEPLPAVAAESLPVAVPPLHWGSLARTAYLVGGGFFLARWLLGVLGLARLLRASTPAPAWVQRRAAALLPGVRVLVSDRIEVPFSCGWFWPTVMLPAGTVEGASREQLDMLLTHETAHLRQGDPAACWLFALAASLFYVFPWFWSLRARLRLDQEYLADAVAVTAGAPVAYAEFLLQWTTRADGRRVPAAAVGVLGRTSDLFRRISMLLRGQPSLETRCPKVWTALVGPALLVVAILTAGVGFAAPVPEDKKPAEPQKDEPQPLVPALPQFPNFDGPLDPEQLKRIQDEIQRVQDEVRKAQEEFQKEFQKGLPRRGPADLQRVQDEVRKMQEGILNRLQLLPDGIQIAPGGLQLNRLPLVRMGRQETRLGAAVSKPSETVVEQLNLPRGQGLVLDRVEENSAAGKAGLKAHDILLELAGKPVSNNPAELVQQLQGIKADQAIEAVVLRKGAKETVKNLLLPEAKPAQPALPGIRFPNVFPNIPALPGVGNNTSMVVTRTGDNFTTQYSENDVKMTLLGTVADGGTLTEATIEKDGTATKYDSLEKVPEAFRTRVKELVEMSATGRVRVIR